jgi:hypothetical protein
MLPWCPREVLELDRWNEPDLGYQGKPPSGERGQLKRLLACTILLRNGAYVSTQDALFEEEFFLKTSATSLVQLTRSGLALGIPEPALGFILWLFDAQLHPALRPFTAFCALALVVAAGFGAASDKEIAEVCDWVDAEEEKSREVLGEEVDSAQWLIGLNSYEGLSDRNEWWFLAKLVFEHPRRAYSDEIRSTLRGSN